MSEEFEGQAGSMPAPDQSGATTDDHTPTTDDLLDAPAKPANPPYEGSSGVNPEYAGDDEEDYVPKESEFVTSKEDDQPDGSEGLEDEDDDEDTAPVLTNHETVAQLSSRLSLPVNVIKELNPDAVADDGTVTAERVRIR